MTVISQPYRLLPCRGKYPRSPAGMRLALQRLRLYVAFAASDSAWRLSNGHRKLLGSRLGFRSRVAVWGLGPRCFWAFGCNSWDSGSIGNRKLSDNLTASKTRMMILTRSKRGQHKTDVFTAFETSLPFANDVVSVCYCFSAVLPVRSHVARLLKRCGALLARRLSGAHTHTHTRGYGLGRRRLIQKWRPTGSESLSVKVVCMLCNNYIS